MADYPPRPQSEPLPMNFGEDAPATPRARTCLRCEKTADHAYKKGWQIPDVAEAMSWVVTGPGGAIGRRYWAALCWRCTEVEKSEREARRLRQGAA